MKLSKISCLILISTCLIFESTCSSLVLGQGSCNFPNRTGYSVDVSDETIFSWRGASSRPQMSGDLNGDLRDDLVVANSDTDSISVYFNKGDSTFEEPIKYPAGDFPDSIFLADVDNDSDVDVISLNREGGDISVLKNNGNGILSAPVFFGNIEFAHSITIGDIDNDGDVDCCATGFHNSRITILLNDGTGIFNTDSTFGWPVLYVRLPILSDINGDGNLDLIALCREGNAHSIGYSINDGAGRFGELSLIRAQFLVSGLTAGDWDEDGDNDLATTDSSDNLVSIWTNDGSANFSIGGSFDVGDNPTTIESVDVDGDSNLDLVVANSHDYTISILNGNGAGSFVPSSETNSNSGGEFLAIGEFNGDSRQDVAVLGSYGIGIFINNGNSFDIEGIEVENFPLWVEEGDVDGDGAVDVAVLSAGDGHAIVSILKNNGDGILTKTVDYPFNGFTQNVEMADYNGDGFLDLAVSYNLVIAPQGHISVRMNDGTGNFGPASEFLIGSYVRRISAGDFDGDGDVDLAAAKSSSTEGLTVIINDGDGKFNEVISYSTMETGLAISVGDLNEDEAPDIVVVEIGGVEVFLNDGSGGFADSLNFDGLATFNSEVAIADLNGDGLPDLVGSASSANSVAVLLNEGSGSFANSVFYESHFRQSSVKVGDVTGDDVPDIITVGRAGEFAVLEGKGDATFALPVKYRSGNYANNITLADFDDDSDLDVAIAVGRQDSVFVLANEFVNSSVFAPETAEVLRGVIRSGSVSEIASSDNLDLGIGRDRASVQAVIEVEFAVATGIENPNDLSFQFESSVFARSSISQSIEMFDFVSKRWITVDVRTAARLSDHTVVVSELQNPLRFVGAKQGMVRARVRYQSLNRRESFSANIDHVQWAVSN